MQTKNSLDFEIKEISEQGTFEGWASKYNVVDSYGDIVMPGAFKSTMAASDNQVVVLNQHNQRDPIGLGTLEDRPEGLWIKGELNLDLKAAQEAYSNVKKRILKGLSIGYETLNERLTKSARELLEIKLYEVSLVTFQACPGALVSSVKAAGDIKTIREFEEFLRDAGFPKAAAAKLAADGWKALDRRDTDETSPADALDVKTIAALLQTRTNTLRRLTWN